MLLVAKPIGRRGRRGAQYKAGAGAVAGVEAGDGVWVWVWI